MKPTIFALLCLESSHSLFSMTSFLECHYFQYKLYHRLQGDKCATDWNRQKKVKHGNWQHGCIRTKTDSDCERYSVYDHHNQEEKN